MPTRKVLANAIRALSMDAVQRAKSGHPGAPMGMADIAEVLWNDYFRHNPHNPSWANRDRFVMSNGHGSMLIYAGLHLMGYPVTLEDLQQFRQLHSKTPGHPEFGYTPGVETTTGPLGQGLSNAIGMAIAERTLAAQFNQPDFPIVDHFTYVFLGDGCMMEGISHEACSLAGRLGLGKLIAFYDDNGISIDGEVAGWFADDTPKRFDAYHWHVISGVDGHDPDALKQAIEAAQAVTDKPSLICCKTVIGWGAPNKQGKASSHGAPLGDEEIDLTRQALDWPHPPFVVPDEIYAGWEAKTRGTELEQAWEQLFSQYEQAHPELAAEFTRRMHGTLPADWAVKTEAFIADVAAKAEKVATRKASQQVLNGFGPLLPELIGGSADLAGSNLTLWSGSQGIQDNPAGNYVFYGVREFAMAAVNSGISLHGGFIPYAATFLVFSDYARNAIRMAALMKIRSIFVMTHDSIGLGEDGPTHQPVEHLATLRMIPNLSVWRPCDTVESAVAWQCALESHNAPACLVFSRQGLPAQPRAPEQIAAIKNGGYVLVDCPEQPEVILIGTGSEVTLCVAAAQQLLEAGKMVRVVSMPSTDVFDAQDTAYQESVLPAAVTCRIAVEAGVSDFWYKYVGWEGGVIGIDQFGESAPGGALMTHFGFTVARIIALVEEKLGVTLS